LVKVNLNLTGLKKGKIFPWVGQNLRTSKRKVNLTTTSLGIILGFHQKRQKTLGGNWLGGTNYGNKLLLNLGLGKRELLPKK